MKSLRQSIKNGLQMAKNDHGQHPSEEQMVRCLYLHVRDYLAQEFCAAMLATSLDTEPEFKALFDKIVK